MNNDKDFVIVEEKSEMKRVLAALYIARSNNVILGEKKVEKEGIEDVGTKSIGNHDLLLHHHRLLLVEMK